ncbi:Riboflavin biosynthesis protein RibF [Nitrospira japonica]|uniref:Riboflavin biosynthesis protein n=1 Tax=Nitrospira japonica TaxID=1325564 RepID=A0A1W1I9R9_9BACT|nr:bifunctional riboflavin kinase/FAD synthetase [Nitrospira japonica]SLM49740.1 Riboflavin biosynthesis protein RibF [Nitrospira japonica]
MLMVTRGLGDAQPRPYPVATIGNFDGHHLGHRALLRTVVDAARRAGGTAMVLTFDPHPVKVLAPHVDLRFLTSPEEKLARLEAAGIDEVVFVEFSPSLASMSPEEFAESVLYRRLKVSEIFVGQHFAFGKGRAGRIADLEHYGKRFGFTVHPFTPVTSDGGVVSSTRIKQLIQTGRMEEAARLLGRWYAVTGDVIPGSQRGQALGWPTANLRLPAHRVVPPDGIYAARAMQDGATYDAVAYIGTRPTFGGGERLLEVNLLDQNRNLYGRPLTVAFVEHLREDRSFATAEALVEQIDQDAARARERLKRAEEVP